MVMKHPPLSDMDGVTIGHWTDAVARTGSTVIRFNRQALSAAEVRGAAPGTRELETMAPGRLEQHVDAIVFTGGSAFGLRAADGVVQELADLGRGYPTSAGPVPIVPAAVIYDMAVGDPVAPTPQNGRHAFRSAQPLSSVEQGRIGAGAGAIFGKISQEETRTGGLGIAQTWLGPDAVTAVVVLNAMGTVRPPGADVRAGLIQKRRRIPDPGQATTLISVVTSAPCDHGALIRVCIAAHDALARLVVPAHTMLDGDVAFASTTAEGPRDTGASMYLSMAAELAVEAAIHRAASATI